MATSTAATLEPSTRPRFDSRFAVLLRAGGVQVGTAPDRAVLVRPPQGVRADRLAGMLHALDGSRRLGDAARRAGLTVDQARPVLAELARAGLLRTPAPRTSRTRSGTDAVLIGDGPLADKLCEHLPRHGVRFRRMRGPARGADVDRLASLPGVPVLLADRIVVDPWTQRVLHECGLPHLQVHQRDAVAVVGPLVVPGRTGCLRCGDLHRRDRDPAWPDLMIQQIGHCGSSDPATVLAAAGLAATRLRSYLRDGPAGLDTQVEVDMNAPAMRTAPWPPHPACTCLAVRRRIPDGTGGTAWDEAQRRGESRPDRLPS